MKSVRIGSVLLFVIILIVSCHQTVYKQDLEVYFTEDFEVKEKTVLGEFGGFGEGYAIEIYEISGSGLEKYINDNLDLPNKGDWNKLPWQRFIDSKGSAEVLDLGLGYYSKNDRIAKQIFKIKELKAEGKSYFSCYYKPSLTNPTAVILYVLDTEEEVIYVIESNT